MPKYHVVVLCSGPVGDAALTYRLTASSQQADILSGIFWAMLSRLWRGGKS